MDPENASHHVKKSNNIDEEMMMAADCEDEIGNGAENRRRPPSHLDHLQPPTSPIGRTFSASAVDFGWKRKKQDSADSDQQHQPSTPNRLSLAGMKRKYSAQQEYSSNSSSSNSNSPCRLPQFVGCPIPSDLAPLKAMTAEQHNPSPSNSAEFITPSQPKKCGGENRGGENRCTRRRSCPLTDQSRPNSPSSAGSRLILPRSRVASIRRESDCGSEKRFGDAEAAHEKLVKSAQQVSLGFEDFCLDDKLFEERKRTKSLTEPISIFTNAFLPQTSSPSPSRAQMDAQKQCYSPSAQQVVKANLAYSPSPSPTPASSPSMHRMRSMSPIAVRQIAKRRYTGSSSNFGNSGGSGLESDGEGVSSSFSLSAPLPKRQCTTSVLARNNANSSPLVRDSTPDLLPLQNQHHPLHPVPSSSSSISELFAASSPVYSAVSSSSSLNNSGFGGPVVHSSSRFLVDPNLTQCFPPYSSHSFDGQLEEEEEDERREGSSQLMSSFCSSSLFNDANSSTTFSSRANTPESASQFGAENSDMPPTTTLLPPRANSSSDCGSSSRSSYSFQQQQQNQNTGTGFGLLPESSSSSSNNNNNNCGEDEAKTDPNNGE